MCIMNNFLKDLTCLSSFRFIVKLTEKYKDFPLTSCSHTCMASPNINITLQNCTFVSKDEPILIHHHHLKPMVYLRVHSWCCIFSGFRQMCNDMDPSLQYHVEYFHCPKYPPYSVHSSFLPTTH